MKVMYTVTVTGTYFLEANNEFEAANIVREAMLGNDNNLILSGGEIHPDIKTIEGYHSTVERLG